MPWLFALPKVTTLLCKGEESPGRDEEALTGVRGPLEGRLESGVLSMDTCRTHIPWGKQPEREAAKEKSCLALPKARNTRYDGQDNDQT